MKSRCISLEIQRLLVRPAGFEPTAFRVGVLRHTTPNGAVKPFFVGYAQIRKPYKKLAKHFQHRLRGRLHVWWSNGGHFAEKKYGGR